MKGEPKSFPFIFLSDQVSLRHRKAVAVFRADQLCRGDITRFKKHQAELLGRPQSQIHFG
jgi:hypothetical protein